MRVFNDIDRWDLAGQGGGIDQRGQPPPPGIRIDLGQLHLGIGDAQQVIEEQHVLRVGVGGLSPRPRTSSRTIKTPYPGGSAQQPSHHMERDVGGMGFAVSREHLDPLGGGQRGDLAHQAALADTRRSHHSHHRAMAVDRAFEQTLHSGHLPAPTHQSRREACGRAIPLWPTQQPIRGNRLVGALDVDHFRLTQDCIAFDQPGGGRAEQHPTRRSDRFNPLRHADLLANGGVTERPRTDFTSDDLPGVQSHPQLEFDPVPVLDFDGKPLRLLLDAQRRQAGTNSVVLQGHWRAEHRQDPVAGEFVDGAAVALHHCRAAVYQLGHDLAQPLRTDRRGDVHRVDHVGEGNSDLLVLRPDICFVDW